MPARSARVGALAPSLRAWVERRYVWLLGGLLLAGTVLRLWIGLRNLGVAADIGSLQIAAGWLQTHPLHIYDSGRWLYPGGYLPVIWVAAELAKALGATFWAVIKIPPILADIAIAGVLAWWLGQVGASRLERLATAALVALGPSFVLISAYHGQIDAFAILPALIAVIVWQRDGDRRALHAGLLIGLAAAIKPTPLFMVLALLPTVRSRREAATLLVAAAAVPLVSLLPTLLVDGHATLHSLGANKGIPGIGGLSLLFQPSLARGWLHIKVTGPTGLTLWLWHQQNLIVGVAVLAAGAYVYRMRFSPTRAAMVIWLAVYVANPNWAYEYFIWGLPFFLLARRQVQAAALQAALVLPAALLYPPMGVHLLLRPDVHSFQSVYAPMMDAIWAAFVVALLLLLRPPATAERRNRAVLWRSGLRGRPLTPA